MNPRLAPARWPQPAPNPAAPGTVGDAVARRRTAVGLATATATAIATALACLPLAAGAVPAPPAPLPAASNQVAHIAQPPQAASPPPAAPSALPAGHTAGAPAYRDGLSPRLQPRDPLDRIRLLGRVDVEASVAALKAWLPSLRADDPQRLDALLLLARDHIDLHHPADAEAIARELDEQTAQQPLARATAMLVRASQFSAHGEHGKAERQCIEASAILTESTPRALRMALAGLWGAAAAMTRRCATCTRWRAWSSRTAWPGGAPSSRRT